MHSKEEKLQAFGRFLDVLDTLREKCPWGQEAGKRKPATEYNRRGIRIV